MEEKLAQYRATKRKQFQQSKSLTEKLLAVFNWVQLPIYKKDNAVSENIPQEYSYVGKTKEKTRIQKLLDVIPRTVQIFVLIVTWTSFWYLFIQLQFGAVYFAISLLIIMYFSMRTERDTNHLSAYSVFNPNYERIDGTFTAEQFEKELRFGPGSVH